MGRPQVPYKASWGEKIDGLYRRSDGRWKILSTGETFTEHDEFTAVAKFKQGAGRRETIFVPLAKGPEGGTAAGDPLLDATDKLDEDTRQQLMNEYDEETGETTIGHLVDKRAMYEMVRREIVETPELAAKHLRLPQIATLASLGLPAEPLELSAIAAEYAAHSTAKRENTKRAALKCWERMVQFIGAVTLADLTTEKLLAYADSIATDPTLKSGASKRAYVIRPKTILAFGLTRGLDAVQIRATLDRMKVMDPKRFRIAYRPPHPISRETFRRLLDAAVGDNAGWRVWLLVGMNLCLHMFETCQLKWDSFDLAAGTYATIREKTEQDRIPQVAVLWPETIAELKALKRTGSPYLFNSNRGTAYHKTARTTRFRQWVRALGIVAVWDDLRDGAYTAAMHGAEEKSARVLAGHRAPGLLDNYVLRNPQLAKAACDAVYRHYFGKLEG